MEEYKMYCKNCGVKISGNERFCSKCGISVQVDTLSENQSGSQSKTLNTVAFTLSIIASIIYLIAVLVLAPQITHYSFASSSNSPAGVAICALVSAILSFASLCCFAFLKKTKQKLNQIGVVGFIIAIIIFVLGLITSIIGFAGA